MQKKILFILCDDFGELVIADYLVANQPINALALCSKKIIDAYDKNNLQLKPIHNLQNIFGCIDDFQPDLVIFASAYLLPLHNIISTQEMKILLDTLCAKGIAIATTDPWMKCWEELRERVGANNLLGNPFLQLQAELDVLLKPIPHIYSTPFKTDRAASFAFFNGHAFRQLMTNRKSSFSRWLFILSSIDYESITGADPSAFLGALLERFTEILASPTNRIVFICPPSCAEALQRRGDIDSRISLVPFCSFTQFQRYIFDCDVGVYWNHLSASIIYHLHKQGAVVCADRGHMLTVCPPLAQHAYRAAWNGAAPHAIDMSQPITASTLQTIVAAADRMEMRIYPEYAKLPTPMKMIESIRRFNCAETK